MHPSRALGALLILTVVPAALQAAGVPLPAGPRTFVPPFGKGVIYSKTLHVATTGSDSTGDGSQTKPFATIYRATQSATPGTQILVHQGTYTNSNYITNLQGTAAAPIRIAGAPGEGPAIIDRQASNPECMHLVDAKYVIVEDLTFRRSTDNGINIDDGGSYATPSDYIILRNLTVEDIGTGGNNDGIKLSGVDHIYVLGCVIQRINAGSGIDMVGCHHSVIAYGEFRNGGSNGTQTKGGSEDILILGNLFVDAGDRAIQMGGSTGAAFFRPIDAPFEGKDQQAIANVIVRSEAAIAYVSVVAGFAANNTIYRPQNWVIRILNENTSKLPPQNGKFYNNIVYFRQADLSTYVNIGSNTLPQTFVFGNNLWYAEDNPGFTGPSLPTPETNGIYQQNPQFLQVGTDFHLYPTSPARAAGLTLSELDGDRDGRAYLNVPTLGAYEIGLTGDVDGDADVDVFDVIDTVAAFGSTPGSPNWDPWADFDRSGLVDVFDVIDAIGNFGAAD